MQREKQKQRGDKAFYFLGYQFENTKQEPQ